MPLGLLGLVLGCYMISTQSSELQNNLNDKGKIAVVQTATHAELALSSGDQEMLEVLGYTALEAPDVTGVLFASYREGELIKVGNIDVDITQLPLDFNNGSPFYLNNNWYFFSDVVTQNISRQ